MEYQRDFSELHPGTMFDEHGRLQKARKTEAVLRHAARRAGLEPRRSRLLDIGCSTGILTHHYAGLFGEVVGVDIPVEGSTMLTVSEKGFGKRTDIGEYRLQGRGGRGTINLKTVPRIGNVSGILQAMGHEDILLISSAGNIIRVKVEEIPVIGRSTQGVKLISLAEGERLSSIERIVGLDEGADASASQSPAAQLPDSDLDPDSQPEQRPESGPDSPDFD